MSRESEEVSIVRVSEKGMSRDKDIVVREVPLTIVLNGRELATLSCSPTELDYLAVGFLLAKGLVKDRQSIKKISLDEPRGRVWVEAEEGSVAGKPLSPAKVESGIKITAGEIQALVDEFSRRSELFRATGGVHGAALGDSESILVFSEDISRHNAMDKVFGRCLLEGISTAGSLIITSGRVSAEVVLKVAGRNVPLLISQAAPTNRGVRLAAELGVTLVGFARDGRMNLYANEWRIKTG